MSYYTEDRNIRLHILVSEKTPAALKEFAQHVSEVREIAIHYPSGVPFTYSVRMILLIGLSIAQETPDVIYSHLKDLDTTEPLPPRGFGLACPVWLMNEIDELARSKHLIRSRTIRALLDLGLKEEQVSTGL